MVKRLSEYIPRYLNMHTDTARLTIQLIRNYDRFKEQADDLLALNMGIQIDGQPKGSGVGDPTARTAEQREHLMDEIRAIDGGLQVVPDEYRAIIWEWVKDGRPLYSIDGSQYVSERTLYEYKRRFISEVARLKGWIIEEG